MSTVTQPLIPRKLRHGFTLSQEKALRSSSAEGSLWEVWPESDGKVQVSIWSVTNSQMPSPFAYTGSDGNKTHVECGTVKSIGICSAAIQVTTIVG
jgi:hypothetical protein